MTTLAMKQWLNYKYGRLAVPVPLVREQTAHPAWRFYRGIVHVPFILAFTLMRLQHLNYMLWADALERIHAQTLAESDTPHRYQRLTPRLEMERALARAKGEKI